MTRRSRNKGNRDRTDRFRRVDLSFGADCRGDYALFLEAKHVQGDGSLDINVGEEPVYLRFIINGEEQRVHGWAKGNQIVQWG